MLTVAHKQEPQQGQDGTKYPHQHSPWLHNLQLQCRKEQYISILAQEVQGQEHAEEPIPTAAGMAQVTTAMTTASGKDRHASYALAAAAETLPNTSGPTYPVNSRRLCTLVTMACLGRWELLSWALACYTVNDAAEGPGHAVVQKQLLPCCDKPHVLIWAPLLCLADLHNTQQQQRSVPVPPVHAPADTTLLQLPGEGIRGCWQCQTCLGSPA